MFFIVIIFNIIIIVIKYYYDVIIISIIIFIIIYSVFNIFIYIYSHIYSSIPNSHWCSQICAASNELPLRSAAFATFFVQREAAERLAPSHWATSRGHGIRISYGRFI